MIPKRRQGNAQEGNPSEILDHRREEIPVPESVFEECEPEIADAGEDDGTCEENFEGVEVESVDVGSEAEEEVVEDRAEGCGCYAV